MSASDQPKSDSPWERFRRAAEITAENWRDPQHDWDAIQTASPAERRSIEQLLVARGARHVIDVQALAMLSSPEADQALRQAFQSGSAEIRAAVVHFAPQTIEPAALRSELLQRIAECDAYAGLSLTLEQIEGQYTPELQTAMLTRIARDPGVAAVHFAGLLLYLHGQAESPFDWDQRPFLLRFNPGDLADRKAALVELCRRIGVRHEAYDSLISDNEQSSAADA
jgi:hypothetical protein